MTRISARVSRGDPYMELRVSRGDDSELIVDVGDVCSNVKITPFIAAVEKELDATVILHSDLPDLVPGAAEAIVHGVFGTKHKTVEDVRNQAHILLAAAAYLEKNPPVDEKQVDAVAALIAKEKGWYSPNSAETPTTMARSLVQQGVRVEVTR